jgi:hypothetical protein
MSLTFWHPISAAQSISRPAGSMSTVAIFQNLAQQCRHVARGSYSRRLLTGIEQHLGEGCSTKRPATRKGFGRFRFRWTIPK